MSVAIQQGQIVLSLRVQSKNRRLQQVFFIQRNRCIYTKKIVEVHRMPYSMTRKPLAET